MAQDKDEHPETSPTDESAATEEENPPGRDPDKPMSDTQRTYLEPLAESQNKEVKEGMNEAEAAQTIDRLQDNAVHVY